MQKMKETINKIMDKLKQGYELFKKYLGIGFKYLFLPIKLFFKYLPLVLHYIFLPITYPLALLGKWLDQFEIYRKIIESKALSYVKAISSIFIWGIGQLFNGQKLKAFLFFIIFVLFISIELGTSSYFEETNAYDKLPGENFGDDYFQSIMGDYYDFANDTYKINYPAFESYLESIDKSGQKISEITEDEFIEFIAQDLKDNNPITYTNLDSNEVIVDENEVSDLEALEQTHIVRSQEMFVDENGTYYTAQSVLGTNAKEYIETDLITGLTNEDHIILDESQLTEFTKNNKVYKVNQGGEVLYFIGVNTFDENELEINKYINVATKEVVDSIDGSAVEISLEGPMYFIDGTYYEYFKPGLIYLNNTLSFQSTVFTDAVRNSMHVTYSQGWNTYSEDDYLRFIIKIYFEIYETEKEAFITAFDNFYFDQAGLFVKSYWAVTTLGTSSLVELESYNTLKSALVGDTSNTPKVPITLLPSLPIMGHVSAQILIEGIIGIIISLFFLIFMIWSVRDAFKVSEKKRQKQKVLDDVQYLNETFEKGFAYFILSPAMMVLSFISLMPIAFGFIIAFTNIAGRKSLIETFDYVGFSNFVALFDFSGTLGATFGQAFWRVLAWTIVWAIFSTATVFFGGFFQAIILNSEKVVFRKFWRTILILPWAIPALLSQMIFKVMFAETGYINQIARQVGLYDLFKSWGILGRQFVDLGGIQKLFYLGNQNIQWFTNPHNPTFVRIVLIVVNIWLGFPYFMALMTGVMTGIDKTLYEAADIDGASNGQKLTKITMPLVLYSTAPILIMTFSSNFNNFGVIYFITGGGPNAGNYNRGYAGDTDILISWMYKLTVDEAIYNMASVFSVLIFFFVGSVTAWNLSKTRAFTED